jgi:hypothetical protein
MDPNGVQGSAYEGEKSPCPKTAKNLLPLSLEEFHLE